jgi:hypothetical protein
MVSISIQGDGVIPSVRRSRDSYKEFVTLKLTDAADRARITIFFENVDQISELALAILRELSFAEVPVSPDGIRRTVSGDINSDR